MIRAEATRSARRDVEADRLRDAADSRDPRLVDRWHVANADTHCGAGCTLGDIAGEWSVFALGWTIAGATVWPEILLDFPLAWSFGVVFQYFTIVPMRKRVNVRQGLWMAIRADTLSIIAFQVGLFGWMIVSATLLWNPPLPINSASHWWMMQIGMILGFLVAYPVNRWLIYKGWKEKMDHRRHIASLMEDTREDRSLVPVS